MFALPALGRRLELEEWGLGEAPNAGLLQSRSAVEAASRQVAASTDATSWRESAYNPPAMVGARGEASKAACR